MEVVWQMADLDKYMRDAVSVSGSNPVLIDQFLENAVEVDVDALRDGVEVFIAGIMELLKKPAFTQGTAPASYHLSICLHVFWTPYRHRQERLRMR